MGLAEKQWSVDMAYSSVNPYNGKVLRTFDDMTDPDKALWMEPTHSDRAVPSTIRRITESSFVKQPSVEYTIVWAETCISAPCVESLCQRIDRLSIQPDKE